MTNVPPWDKSGAFVKDAPSPAAWLFHTLNKEVFYRMAVETKASGTVEQAAMPQTPDGPPRPESQEQAVIPGMGENGTAPAMGKVINLTATQGAVGDQEKAAGPEKAPEAEGQKKGRGRSPKPKDKTDKAPGKDKRAAPGRGTPSTPAKAGRVKNSPEKPAPAKEEAPPLEPPQTRDATRAEKEEIVYLDLSELHPFKDHPFGVRDDAEMRGLVESVRSGGVNQPALVRPREGGGYEIIAGHRRQRASELAGYRNMPCIVRNMTDDEADPGDDG